MKLTILISLVFFFLFVSLVQADTIWTGLGESGGCYTAPSLILMGCSLYHFNNVTITNVTGMAHTCSFLRTRFYIANATTQFYDSGMLECGCPPYGADCYCIFNITPNIPLNVSADYQFQWYLEGRTYDQFNTTTFPVYPLGQSSGSNYLSGICTGIYISGIQQVDFDVIVPTTTTTIPHRCVIMDCSGLRGFPMIIIGFLCSMANFLFCFPVLLGVLIIIFVVYQKWFKVKK